MFGEMIVLANLGLDLMQVADGDLIEPLRAAFYEPLHTSYEKEWRVLLLSLGGMVA